MQGKIIQSLDTDPKKILNMLEEASGTKMFDNKKGVITKILEKKDLKTKQIEQLLCDEILPVLEILTKEKINLCKWIKVANKINTVQQLCILNKLILLRLISTSKKIKFSQRLKKSQVNIAITMTIHVVMYMAQKLINKLSESRQCLILEIKKLQLVKCIFEKYFVHFNIIETSKKSQEIKKELSLTLNDVMSSNSKLELRVKKYYGMTIVQKIDPKMSQSAHKSLKTLKIPTVETRLGIIMYRFKKSICVNITVFKNQIQKHFTLIGTVLQKSMFYFVRYRNKSIRIDERRTFLRNSIVKCNNNLTLLRNSLNQSLFRYSDSGNTFDRNQVKGVIAFLFSCPSLPYCLSLEVAAGGKLFHVVVDSDQTAKEILQKASLNRRVTLVPENIMNLKKHEIVYEQIKLFFDTQQLTKIKSARSLITCDPKFVPLMIYTFGNSVICQDVECAQKIALGRHSENEQKMRAITIHGDDFNPNGIITGGNRTAQGSILEKINHSTQQKLVMYQYLTKLEEANINFYRFAEILKKKKFISTKKRDEKINFEASKKEYLQIKIRNKLPNSTFYTTNFNQLFNWLKNKQRKTENQVIKFERQSDKFSIHERGLSSDDSDDSKARKDQYWNSYPISHPLTNTSRKLSDVIMVLELINKVSEAKKKHQLIISMYFFTMKHVQKQMQNELINYKVDFERTKKILTQICVMSKNLGIHVKTGKNNHHLLEDSDQVEWNHMTFLSQQKTSKTLQKRYIAYNGLALTDNQLQISSRYGQKIGYVESEVEKQVVNLQEKKNSIASDKNKITNIVKNLEIRRKLQNEKTLAKVCYHFGLIFNTLVPNINARLKKHDVNEMLDGVKIEIRIGTAWTNKFSNLSGGQKSLLALSLLFSFSLINPAPIYILDEIDAALDSHNSHNVSTMLKKYFPISQFIIVTLKNEIIAHANKVFEVEHLIDMSKMVTNYYLI
eukprot:gnl/MRDRNA2_/MRDRNA2_86798_c0_seq1.p1 gnl/MRDRNA2_/MRDRNA2_86798_c0~~gnl/MRDRNA2_/MRDRNA2_86798_c0_seq1.p1  ORF type:complete len:1101 (+),score=14.73 gnl/MRDRNA2_/MRDRNA2_86798_c0_seq1:447-3305(+)